ncbi:ABC transporter ATP-binding protein [Niallia sp. FSL R7-0271]|uniref:ABC transporter ATP-binding protein n=1 Tax=Niallia sp. FSL R7-0271 TaxID=2921678 RepID=UPI0030F7DC98
MIQLQSVKKSYPVNNNSICVLNKINLNVEAGEYISIMGPSGSGKSTIMNIIGCLDQPSDGKYLFQGKDITSYQDQQLARIRNRSIGFVYQQFNLLPRLSVKRNVELPMIYAGIKKKERDKRTFSALEKMNLKNFLNYMPNSLSGGQKQRVAIARAIVNNPDLILADEPTGSLDSSTSLSIIEYFNLLNREGTTIILVTHNKEIAAFSKRKIFVKDGDIIKDG